MRCPEGYIGFVEELPGVNTQGAIWEESRMEPSRRPFKWYSKQTERWLNGPSGYFVADAKTANQPKRITRRAWMAFILVALLVSCV